MAFADLQSLPSVSPAQYHEATRPEENRSRPRCPGPRGAAHPARRPHPRCGACSGCTPCPGRAPSWPWADPQHPDRRPECAQWPPSTQGTEKEGKRGGMPHGGGTSGGREARQSRRRDAALADGAGRCSGPGPACEAPADARRPTPHVSSSPTPRHVDRGGPFPWSQVPETQPCVPPSSHLRGSWGCVTKCHKLGDLTQQKLIVRTSGGQDRFLLEILPQAPLGPGLEHLPEDGEGGRAEEGGGGGCARSLVHMWDRVSEAGARTRESRVQRELPARG